MPPQPVCPFCAAKLLSHEFANDKCPACRGRPAAAGEWVFPAWDEPVPRRRPSALPGRFAPDAVAMLRLGVNLVRWGVGLNLIFGAVAWVGAWIAQSIDGTQAAKTALAFTVFGGLFQTISGMVVLLGVCFCCSVPRGGRGRKWAQGVSVCLVVGGFLVLAVVSIFAAKVSRPGPAAAEWRPALMILLADLAVALLVGAFFFCLLCVAVSRFFGDRRLAKSLVACFVVSLAAVVLAGLDGSAWVAEGGAGLAVGILPDLAVGAGLSLWICTLLTRLYHLIPLPGEPHWRRDDPTPRRGDWRPYLRRLLAAPARLLSAGRRQPGE